DPRENLGRPRGGGLKKVVGRSERIEHHVPVGEKVLSIVGPHADGVGKYTQWERFCQLGTGINLLLVHELIDHLGRDGGKLRPQGVHDSRRKRFVEGRAGPGMLRWIRFENDTRQSKSAVASKITHANSTCR